MDNKAFPNIDGILKSGPRYDLGKWINTFKKILITANEKNVDPDQVILQCTTDWDVDERLKFTYWMKYYQSGTPEKYKVKNANLLKTAFLGAPQILDDWANRSDRMNSQPSFARDRPVPQKTKRELDMEKANAYKKQMKSRLSSLKGLLSRFNEIMPKINLDAIEQEIFNLGKSIRKLEVYASMLDCTVRTANIFKKLGFDEGADFLIKVAAEPVATPTQSQATNPLPHSKDVLQSMPPGPSPKLDNAKPEVVLPLSTIISRLEGLSKKLKSRSTVRELASIDILLNQMGLASYFPEVTDAQAKLIEAYGYSSNRIEGVIAKLRGTGITKPEPIPISAPMPEPTVAPKKEEVNKDELMQAPMGQVQTSMPPVKK